MYNFWYFEQIIITRQEALNKWEVKTMFGKKDAKSKSSKASKQRGVEAGREMADCGSKTTRDSKTSRSSK